MTRLAITGLVLFVLSSPGERIAAAYREDTVLALESTDTFAMETNEVTITLDGVELPPEAMEDSGMDLSMREETSVRTIDHVLAASAGRPTRVRRTFERLREHSVDEGEETEKTGPLEGLTLVLGEEDGEAIAVLEGDEEVDELYLADHRLTNDIDLLLPDGEVALGAKWPVDDAALREFLGFDSGPVLFEPDEGEEEGNDLFDELFEEGTSVSAEVEFVEIEERDGLRCAVLAIQIEFRAELTDPAALGIELEEGMEDASGAITADVRGEGKLWFALAEGRPVAMEQTLEGSLDFHLEGRMRVEQQEFLMRTEIACSLEGESTSTWKVQE